MCFLESGHKRLRLFLIELNISIQKLITITEKLGDFKSIELSRVVNYFAIHFPKNDASTSETLNYFFKLYTSKVPDEWLSFEEELRLVGL